MGRYLYLLFSVFIIFNACKHKEPPLIPIVPIDAPSLPARGFFMGILPTPAVNQTFDSAYRQVSRYIEFVPVWGRPTPFYNLADDLAGSWGQTFVTNLIRGNGMFPIINLSFIGPDMNLVSPPDIQNPSLSNQQWRNAYKSSAIEVVKTIRPLYLSLGNEVNRWYEVYDTSATNPNGFQHFVSLYYEIYDTLKILAPTMKIFCTFAREIVAELREANLNVLKLFDPKKLDLLVFTSYPHSVSNINRPADIPINYYSRIESIMPNKQFGFSEIAWPSMPAFGGDSAQAEFLMRAVNLLTRNQGMHLHLFGWAWLTDLDSNDYLGLIRRDGTEKLAYAVWKNIAGPGK
ncbi:MAG: hypothetical protein N2748_03105 [candidate division WOR-3 bacterium]|nr:hypothetical protein [candidate division WOR-3 bacterium]